MSLNYNPLVLLRIPTPCQTKTKHMCAEGMQSKILLRIWGMALEAGFESTEIPAVLGLGYLPVHSKSHCRYCECLLPVALPSIRYAAALVSYLVWVYETHVNCLLIHTRPTLPESFVGNGIICNVFVKLRPHFLFEGFHVPFNIFDVF